MKDIVLKTLSTPADGSPSASRETPRTAQAGQTPSTGDAPSRRRRRNRGSRREGEPRSLADATLANLAKMDKSSENRTPNAPRAVGEVRKDRPVRREGSETRSASNSQKPQTRTRGQSNGSSEGRTQRSGGGRPGAQPSVRHSGGKRQRLRDSDDRLLREVVVERAAAVISDRESPFDRREAMDFLINQCRLTVGEFQAAEKLSRMLDRQAGLAPVGRGGSPRKRPGRNSGGNSGTGGSSGSSGSGRNERFGKGGTAGPAGAVASNSAAKRPSGEGHSTGGSGRSRRSRRR